MHNEEKKLTSFSVNHLLQAAEGTMSAEGDKNTESTNKESLDSEKVKIVLEEADLWRRFKALTNEMIVTKNGR